MEECLQKVRVDVALSQALIVGLDARLARRAADHHLGVLEMKRIVRSPLGEGEHTRNRGPSATGPAGALLIVLP